MMKNAKLIAIFLCIAIIVGMAVPFTGIAADDAVGISYRVQVVVENEDGVPQVDYRVGDTFTVKVNLVTVSTASAPFYAIQYRFNYNDTKLSLLQSETELWGDERIAYYDGYANAAFIDETAKGVKADGTTITLAAFKMQALIIGESTVSADRFVVTNKDATLRIVDTETAASEIRITTEGGNPDVNEAKLVLDSDIKTAWKNLRAVLVSSSRGTDVSPSLNWTTSVFYNAYMDVIEDSESVFSNPNATLENVNSATENLKDAYEEFKTHLAKGNHIVSTSTGAGAESSSNSVYGVNAYAGENGSINDSSVNQKAIVGTSVSIGFTPNKGYEAYEALVNGKSYEASGDRFTLASVSGNTTVVINFRRVLPFIDVEKGTWYHDAVRFVFDNELFNGVTADTFVPNGNMTRAMLVTVLSRLDKADTSSFALPVQGSDLKFVDVAADAWYAGAVAWAYTNGVVLGTSDTTFSPDTPITREQMVTMLWKYAAYKNGEAATRANIEGYADVSEISSWAKDAMSWSVAEDLVNGVTDTTLAPKSNVTRAQVAVIMMRYAGKLA